MTKNLQWSNVDRRPLFVDSLLGTEARAHPTDCCYSINHNQSYRRSHQDPHPVMRTLHCLILNRLQQSPIGSVAVADATFPPARQPRSGSLMFHTLLGHLCDRLWERGGDTTGRSFKIEKIESGPHRLLSLLPILFHTYTETKIW